jgi:hypothetical protein
MKFCVHVLVFKIAFVLLDFTPALITAGRLNRNCSSACTCEKIAGTVKNILVMECRKRDTISGIPRMDPGLMANVTEL